MSSGFKTKLGTITGRFEYGVRGLWDRMLIKDIETSKKRGDSAVEIGGMESVRDLNQQRRAALAKRLGLRN